MRERQQRRRRPRVPAFNLRKAMFVLPNAFTLSSVFCGIYAILMTSGAPGPQQFYQATLAIFFGLFFDMADGRVARLTKTQSDFGVQLDSLADVITFGVAPAIVVYKWSLSSLGLVGLLATFAYTACGALRLARFNVLAARGTGAKGYFVGLPIPLAAGVVISLVMFHQVTLMTRVVTDKHILVLVLLLSYLMVSNVRYRSFKDVKPSKKSLSIAFTLLLLFAVIALRVQPTFALMAFFVGYVGFGLLEQVLFFRRRRVEATALAAGGTKTDVETKHEIHR